MAIDHGDDVAQWAFQMVLRGNGSAARMAFRAISKARASSQQKHAREVRDFMQSAKDNGIVLDQHNSQEVVDAFCKNSGLTEAEAKDATEAVGLYCQSMQTRLGPEYSVKAVADPSTDSYLITITGPADGRDEVMAAHKATMATIAHAEASKDMQLDPCIAANVEEFLQEQADDYPNLRTMRPIATRERDGSAIFRVKEHDMAGFGVACERAAAASIRASMHDADAGVCAVAVDLDTYREVMRHPEWGFVHANVRDDSRGGQQADMPYGPGPQERDGSEAGDAAQGRSPFASDGDRSARHDLASIIDSDAKPITATLFVSEASLPHLKECVARAGGKVHNEHLVIKHGERLGSSFERTAARAKDAAHAAQEEAHDHPERGDRSK